MTKLNQVIAIEKGVKSRTYSALTELNKKAQRAELFNGFSKVYKKKDEDSEDLPPENKKVQVIAKDIISEASKNLKEMMYITARKEWSNCSAKADIELEGVLVAEGVPVTYLLFLEKMLTDWKTFIGNLPLLDDTEDWMKDEENRIWKTRASPTHRTKKVQKPIVMYQATPEHPAQTEMITEDIIAGHWYTVKQSGAISRAEKEVMLERAEKMLDAVKQAREAANSGDEVTPPMIADAVFQQLLYDFPTA